MMQAELATVSMPVSRALSIDRIDTSVSVTSKKRLLEHMAKLLAKHSSISDQTIFKVLTERERLGSTGIGDGVALPHGRLAELDEPRLAVVILDEALEYQALDGKKVGLAIGLIVPVDANEEHLQILAKLAGLLSESSFRDQLLQARNESAVYDVLTLHS